MVLPELEALKLSAPSAWSPPQAFDPLNPADVVRLQEAVQLGVVRRVVDLSRSPAVADERRGFGEPSVAGGSTMFLFPWSGDLVEFPSQSTHQRLRTSRNRHLITEAEQARLFRATVAVFGLSVGSNVAERLIAGGIGGCFVLADPDLIEPTNLNRISATSINVGESKLEWLAKRISELDPYIEQHHLPSGVTGEALRELCEQGPKPSVLVDEVDDLAVKLAIRQQGQAYGIPVVMATDVADTVIIDIERHDLPGGARFFGGRLSDKDLAALQTEALSAEARRKLTMRIVGPRYLTARLVHSALNIGTELTGLPQLGTTAAIAGAAAAVAIREIILGRKVRSGRYAIPLRRAMRLQRIGTPRDAASAIWKLRSSG